MYRYSKTSLTEAYEKLTAEQKVVLNEHVRRGMNTMAQSMGKEDRQRTYEGRH